MAINSSSSMTYQDTMSKIHGGLKTKNVTFIVTESCNLKCTYCYEVGKNSKRMTKDIGKKIVDSLFEQYYSNNEYLNNENSQSIILDFIGGEPFLEVDLMDYIVEYFKYKAITLKHPWAIDYMISVSTNGTLYFNEKVQNFINKNKNRMSISITIDGNKELHDSCRIFHDGRGSYDVVEKSIKDQIKKFDKVTTKLTLSPDNIKHTFEAIKNLYDLGLCGVHANCVFEEGWNNSHAKTMYDELKKLADFIINNNLYNGEFYCGLFDASIGSHMSENDNENWCGGTGKMLAIGPEGDMYPCLRYSPFTLSNKRKSITIGHVDSGIGTTSIEKENISCLQCITRKSQSTEECYNCPIASGCGWCSGYNYDKFGTANKRATFICIMHKARVLANAYFYNKAYKKEGLDTRFEMNIPKEWALEIIDENEYDLLKELSK